MSAQQKTANPTLIAYFTSKRGRDGNRPNWGQRHRAPCCGESYIVNEV